MKKVPHKVTNDLSPFNIMPAPVKVKRKYALFHTLEGHHNLAVEKKLCQKNICNYWLSEAILFANMIQCSLILQLRQPDVSKRLSYSEEKPFTIRRQ
jgi:hypothetical protein